MQITLKAARVNAGLTIKQASERLGISHTTLTKWERCSGLINPIWQNKLGEIYNINPDYIFFGTEMDLKSINSNVGGENE